MLSPRHHEQRTTPADQHVVPEEATTSRRTVVAAEGEDVQITLCPDGPLLVRGAVTLLDADGEPVPGRRSTMALCRCGASAIKPFCDGTHKVNGFTTRS